jgi:hypothetical protein
MKTSPQYMLLEGNPHNIAVQYAIMVLLTMVRHYVVCYCCYALPQTNTYITAKMTSCVKVGKIEGRVVAPLLKYETEPTTYLLMYWVYGTSQELSPTRAHEASKIFPKMRSFQGEYIMPHK